MDAERIAKIRARLDAATSRPWEAYRPRPQYRLYEVSSTSPAGLNDVLAEVSGFNASADADLIAHAPTDIEDLLAEVERLTAEHDALAETVERVRGLHERRWVLIGGVGGFVCATCEVPVESEPCPTVRALDEHTAVMRAIDGLLDQRGAQTGAQAHGMPPQAPSGVEEAHPGDPRPIPGRESGVQEAQP